MFFLLVGKFGRVQWGPREGPKSIFPFSLLGSMKLHSSSENQCRERELENCEKPEDVVKCDSVSKSVSVQTGSIVNLPKILISLFTGVETSKTIFQHYGLILIKIGGELNINHFGIEYQCYHTLKTILYSLFKAVYLQI